MRAIFRLSPSGLGSGDNHESRGSQYNWNKRKNIMFWCILQI